MAPFLAPAGPGAMPTKARPVEADVPDSLQKGEARLIQRTGQGFGHWFTVLDAFGAVEKGHTASARHLAEDHGVDGWYAQQITVQYERARGLRGVNQRRSGEYEVSVSKVLPGSVTAVAKALDDAQRRGVWLEAAAPWLRRDLEAALRGVKGLKVRDRGDARLRFRTETATVDIRIDPKPGGRASFVAQNMKLRAREDVERYRSAWRQALDALGLYLGG